jgi:hypothetical protein
MDGKSTLMLAFDVGFSKTGTALFEIGPEKDTLIRAFTYQNELDKSMGSVVHQDYQAITTLFSKLYDLTDSLPVSGIVAELPSGGAQGARANRCMGIATGMFACLTYVFPNVPFEIYSPHEVEVALGIALKAGDAKGMKKGEKTAWKKARMQAMVLEDQPEFRGWQPQKYLVEDSYDAAAAFIASRRTKNGIYWKLKNRVIEEHRAQPMLPLDAT